MTTPATGSAAAPFNFDVLGVRMHSAAFVRGAPALEVSKADYLAYREAMQAVEDAAACLNYTQAGIDLLLNMMGGADVEPYVVQAMNGLLGPIALQLKQHGVTLNATIQKEK